MRLLRRMAGFSLRCNPPSSQQLFKQPHFLFILPSQSLIPLFTCNAMHPSSKESTLFIRPTPFFPQEEGPLGERDLTNRRQEDREISDGARSKFCSSWRPPHTNCFYGKSQLFLETLLHMDKLQKRK